jgi:hypothetical protein
MAAFLAHYRALSAAATQSAGSARLSDDERKVMATMQPLMESLTPSERAVLTLDVGKNWTASTEASRRYRRAELKLHRILMEKGVLQG